MQRKIMAKINHKHKTIGVSFNPLLRQRASRRARELGMSFSRYVSLCVEAEAGGLMPAADLRSAAQSGAEREGAAAAEAAGNKFLRDTAIAHGKPLRNTGDNSKLLRDATGSGRGLWNRETAAAELTDGAPGQRACLWPDAGSGRSPELIDERLFRHVSTLLEQAALPFVHRPLLGPVRTDFLVRDICDGVVLPPKESGCVEGAAAQAEREGADTALSQAGSEYIDTTLPQAGRECIDTALSEGESAGIGIALPEGGAGAAVAMAPERKRGAAVVQVSRGLPQELGGIAIECCHPVDAASAVMLGRAVMLQQVAGVKAVLLCVPYLSALPVGMQGVFDRQNICVTTPDTLLQVLRELLAMCR